MQQIFQYYAKEGVSALQILKIISYQEDEGEQHSEFSVHIY